jgi:hypothetical protein
VALSIDGHNGHAEFTTEAEFGNAPTGVFGAEWQRNFVDFEIPFLRLFENGRWQAGT